MEDDEIAAHYPASELLELTGPVGTMLAVDTRSFHMGKPLVERDRLLFQIQFADSLCGQNYPPVSVPANIPKSTINRLKQNKRCFSNFELPCD